MCTHPYWNDFPCFRNKAKFLKKEVKKKASAEVNYSAATPYLSFNNHVTLNHCGSK